MTRGNRPISALALVCLLAGACGRLQPSRAAGAPAPTLDPSRAIVLSVLSDSVYLIDPVTGQIRSVARGLTDFQSGYASWSPDHQRIAWGDAGITILDTRSGTLSHMNQGQLLSMPAWSPDGSQIVYGDGTGLWVTPVARPRPKLLDLPPNIAPIAMSWWPGLAIAFEGLELDCGQSATCLSTNLSEIWTIRPDGSGARQITRVGHAENPKWSPDHSQILFIRSVTTKGTRQSEVWAIGANGQGARQISPAIDVIAAAWSPNGQSVATVRPGAARGTLQVWIAGADGSNPRPLGTPLHGTEATIDW